MKQLDNIHYSYRQIDGYPQPFKAIIGPREPGKTTMMWLKIYNGWLKDKRPWLYLVRNVVEISEVMISTICETSINDFIDDTIKFTYNKASFKEGIVDIFINGERFFRMVALNIKLKRIKQACLPKIKGVYMDEFIIDPRTGETYLKGEAFKLKEAYTTWRRQVLEGEVLPVYFTGNVYSLFNPYFVAFDIDVSKLKPGEFYVKDKMVIHWCQLHPLLKEKLLQENPFYQFDEEYTKYALEGLPKNDSNIKLGKLKPNYSLRFVLKYDNMYIGIFYNPEAVEDKYHCREVNEISAKRIVYVFDFQELIDRSALISLEGRIKMQKFKEAMGRHQVSFDNINIYYFMEDIYKQL